MNFSLFCGVQIILYVENSEQILSFTQDMNYFVSEYKIHPSGIFTVKNFAWFLANSRFFSNLLFKINEGIQFFRKNNILSIKCYQKQKHLKLYWKTNSEVE